MLQLNALNRNMSCSARNAIVAPLACFYAVRFFSYCFFYPYFVKNNSHTQRKPMLTVS